MDVSIDFLQSQSQVKDFSEGVESPRVTFNVNRSHTSLAGPLQSVPSMENSSVKLKRRRYSQTKSQSSVSFDDPVSTVINAEDKTPQSKVGSTAQKAASVLMPVNRLAINVADHSSMSSLNTRVGNAIAATSAFKTVPISTPNQYTSVMTLTSNHPITYQLYMTKKSVRPAIHPLNRIDIQMMNRESLTVECRPSYCTLHVRQPCHKEMGRQTSVSNQWKSLLPPSTVGRAAIDMKTPMTCYKTRKYGLRTSLVYKVSNMDTRGILTHSSYWQYKNKMRVMQAMPSQDGASTSHDLSKHREGKPAPLKQPSRTKPVAAIPNAAPAMSTVSRIDNNNMLSVANNNNRPSVITRDVKPPVSAHKKMLQRSQSTPNAGAEGQSKLIAGGFKSDEDYVYIRGRGKGKYVCQQCGIRCRKPSMLKKHIRTHTDLRPYSCKHCNFSFKTKGGLTLTVVLLENIEIYTIA